MVSMTKEVTLRQAGGSVSVTSRKRLGSASGSVSVAWNDSFPRLSIIAGLPPPASRGARTPRRFRTGNSTARPPIRSAGPCAPATRHRPRSIHFQAKTEAKLKVRLENNVYIIVFNTYS